MNLYVVRHGEAEHRKAHEDADRELTGHGRKGVRKLWRKLVAEGIVVDRVVSSPYVRARQTAEIIVEQLGMDSVENLPLLVPEANPAMVLDWLLAQPDEQTLVLVSHMPLVGLLTGMLVEGTAGARVPFVTGGVACLDCEVYAAGGARLSWLRSPEEL